MNITALTAELSAKLGLQNAARRDAVHGIPKQNATEMTGAETEAVTEADRAGQQAVTQLGEHCRGTEQAIQACRATLPTIQPRRQAVGDQPPLRDEEEINRAEADRNAARANYNRFKANNQLDRDASGDDRFVQLIWASVIIIIEGLFNSYFFAPATAYGIVGGFIAAFFFSFANVGFAFVGGALGLRNINHCDAGRKLFGLIIFLLFLSVCIIIVFLSAWYRGHLDAARVTNTVTPTLAFDAWQASVGSLRSADFWALIASMNSFLLMFVGALCALFGFWKGYEFDDPYPGFGGMFRQKEQAQENYDDIREAHEKRVAKWRDDRNLELQNLLQSVEQAGNAVHTAHGGFQQAVADVNGIPTQTADLARRLLQVYRETNTTIRADAAPSYFEQFPRPEEFRGLNREHTRWRKRCEELQKEVNGLQKQCRDEVEQIQQKINLEQEL